MNSKSTKAPTVSGVGGFLNHIITDGDQGFNVSNFNTKKIEKQLLSSGAVERLAEDLTTHLKQHRTIRISTRCKGCKRAFTPQKLNLNVLMCRRCLNDAQTVDASKQNRFIAEAARNYVASLRYQISIGGVA